MLDGKALTGTTTILQVINKPMLIQWSANMAVEYILASAITKGKDTLIIPLSALDEAKTAHRKKKEKAGDWGKEVHKHIEMYVKEGKELPEGVEENVKKSFLHFVNWAKENKVKFLGSEVNVYSRDMWVGGICDLVVEIDGKKWIADIKTGSGIYPEHFWQMGSYDMCMNEMKIHDTIEGYIVLNIKKDGTFEEKRSVSNEDNRSAFKAALTIYRLQEKLKNSVI